MDCVEACCSFEFESAIGDYYLPICIQFSLASLMQLNESSINLNAYSIDSDVFLPSFQFSQLTEDVHTFYFNQSEFPMTSMNKSSFLRCFQLSCQSQICLHPIHFQFHQPSACLALTVHSSHPSRSSARLFCTPSPQQAVSRLHRGDIPVQLML